MVSKASDDLPEPERPVMQTRRFRGSRTVTSFRLCSRAPWTTSSSAVMEGSLARRTYVPLMAELRTRRLLLRQWRDADLEPFAALNADPQTMRYFPAPLSREESDALAEG